MMNRRILEQKAVRFFQTVELVDWFFTGRSFYYEEKDSFIGEFSRAKYRKVELRNMAVSSESLNKNEPEINWLNGCANEYLHSFGHKGLRFSTVRLADGNYGYIDHDGKLTTTLLGIAKPLGTEEAAIDEARLYCELRLHEV